MCPWDPFFWRQDSPTSHGEIPSREPSGKGLFIFCFHEEDFLQTFLLSNFSSDVIVLQVLDYRQEPKSQLNTAGLHERTEVCLLWKS